MSQVWILPLFKSSKDEVSYSNLRLEPLLFQDDICRLATNFTDALAGNMKLESIAESKLLDFNVEKSSIVVMGPTAKKNDLLRELEETPLTLCNKAVYYFKTRKIPRGLS